MQTKADLDKETKDTYTVTVTAADSLGVSSTITVTINVTNVDEMPDLEGEAPEEYAENGTGAVATFTAEDPEGESIIWSVSGADSEDFTIENGVLRFLRVPLTLRIPPIPATTTYMKLQSRHPTAAQ